VAIEADDGFRLQLGAGDDEADERGVATIRAERLVNAAGPFIDEIARMLDTSLPVNNVLQQKIAFEDRNSAIPRRLPFAIDLDHQMIDWTVDERNELIADPDYAWLAEEMPGAIHCRPDGGDEGTWVKLGWAFNQAAESARPAPELDDTFPEIVLRGAARLNPSLKACYGKLPRHRHHYGGYYTMTDENWPLIGEMAVAGSYVVGAMSGFGTMAACLSLSTQSNPVAREPFLLRFDVHEAYPGQDLRDHSPGGREASRAARRRCARLRFRTGKRALHRSARGSRNRFAGATVRELRGAFPGCRTEGDRGGAGGRTGSAAAVSRARIGG